MHFSHAPALWNAHPELVPGVLFAQGITPGTSVLARTAPFNATAASRLASGPESELPEIQAWRRTFSRMGLKPTQYRCAAESLLRRFKKEGALPPLHPLVDLCNAVSLAFALPIAVFDVSHVEDFLEVRPATGSERYLAFSGEVEQPEPGEVVFADAAGNAHARRWTHRQSALSAIRDETTAVLIVCEAMHASAAADVSRLVTTLAAELEAVWGIATQPRLLSPTAPRFEF